MLFRDLKTNYPIYVLDKQKMTLVEGKVVQSGFPRNNPGFNNMTSPSMVIDITVEADGKTAEYVMPESQSVCTASNGNLVFSADQETMAKELEAIQKQAKQVIDSVPYYEKVLKESPDLILRLKPELRKELEIKRRFEQVDSDIKEIKESLGISKI